VTRGWLGVVIQDLSEDMADYYSIPDKKGVMVMEVMPGNPAEAAGIQPKDIIVEINGQPVSTSRDLTGTVASLNVGEKAKVILIRNGKKQTVQVEIAKRPEDTTQLASGSPGKNSADELGIRVSNLTPEISKRLNTTQTDGAVIEHVDPEGKGSEAGLSTGDIIKEVNHTPIKNAKDYASVISKIKKNDPIQMFIWRSNAGFLVIKLTK
jgi:serine protease Do